jgi:nucleoside-diphosphate-sugar epimerase
MKILVTGGTGFIGANLIHKLSSSKNEIHLLTRNTSKFWRLDNVQEKLVSHDVDLLNLQKLKKIIKKIEPEIVYHCAAYGIKPSEKNFYDLIDVNVVGTFNLFSSLNDLGGVKRIVNLGSFFEYGTKSNKKNFLETDCVNPITGYGISKVAQTNIARYFFMSKNLPVSTLRIFSPYGMYESKGRLIPDIMLSLFNKKTLKISSTSASRDFVFIADVIDAIEKAGKTSKINGEIINIGYGKCYSIKEILELVSKLFDKKPEIAFDVSKKREFDVTERRPYSNIKKASSLLGWTPKHPIEEGLKKTYKWFESNLYRYN